VPAGPRRPAVGWLVSRVVVEEMDNRLVVTIAAAAALLAAG
jgi:hypothetical protein